jgi:hypothetical protein
VGERRPETRAHFAAAAVKAVRQYTHNLKRLVIDINDVAHHVRIGRPTRLPIVLAQHSHGRCARLRIARIEKASPRRSDSEAAKIIAGHQVRSEARLAFDNQSKSCVFRD